MLGLVAQAHLVSLLLRKAVYPTRCHALSGEGQGLQHVGQVAPRSAFWMCMSLLTKHMRVSVWDRAVLATPLTLFR